MLPLLPRICAVKLDAGNLLQIHGGHPRASHGKVTGAFVSFTMRDLDTPC